MIDYFDYKRLFASYICAVDRSWQIAFYTLVFNRNILTSEKQKKNRAVSTVGEHSRSLGVNKTRHRLFKVE